MSVGFADLARFTRSSGGLSIEELAEMVEQFYATTAGVVVDGGGRVVKTIGDEVMFTCADPVAAASIGLGLLEAISPATGYPAFRVGVASGPVLAREGDVFGAPVNLASRLVAAARPDSVLVDTTTRNALDDRFALSALAPFKVSGIGSLQCWRIRWRREPPR